MPRRWTLAWYALGGPRAVVATRDDHMAQDIPVGDDIEVVEAKDFDDLLLESQRALRFLDRLPLAADLQTGGELSRIIKDFYAVVDDFTDEDS